MRCFVADADLQPIALRGDEQVAIAESAGEVEGLARRLLHREPQRVAGHALLDRFAYWLRGAEVAIGGDQTCERLVRSLEVVRMHEEREAPLAIAVVREHGTREKLVPERLPEALDLPERLRVMRPTHDVPDPLTAKLLLEDRLAAPRGVLTPLVGEDLVGRTESSDPAIERFEHEVAALLMRDGVRHDEARAVVEEPGEVDPLVATQQKREDVRLPHLVRLCALEASRWRRGTLVRGR